MNTNCAAIAEKSGKGRKMACCMCLCFDLLISCCFQGDQNQLEGLEVIFEIVTKKIDFIK